MYLPLLGVLFVELSSNVCECVLFACLLTRASGNVWLLVLSAYRVFTCISCLLLRERHERGKGLWVVIVYQESVFLKEKYISDWQNLFCERNNAEQSSLAHEDKSIFKMFSHVCLNTFNGKRSNLP